MELTFADQSPVFLASLGKRKRRPVKPATLAAWESIVSHWIIPKIGPLHLKDFQNAALKRFADDLCAEKLSPRSIREIVGLVKRIIASALDEDGEPRFPRTWSASFLDLPEIKPANTAAPTPEEIHKLLAQVKPRYGVLYVTLLSTGLRISECLSLRIGSDGTHSFWSRNEALLSIKTGMFRGKDVWSPKTQSGIRVIPLAPIVNDMLIKFVGNRTGFLFAARTGKPLAYALVLRNLKSITRIRPHDLRRFRASQLRRSRVHADVVRALLGHASESITDEYSRMQNLDELRKGVQAAGLGFVVPNRLLGSREHKESVREFEEVIQPVAL
jgi:integrase